MRVSGVSELTGFFSFQRFAALSLIFSAGPVDAVNCGMCFAALPGLSVLPLQEDVFRWERPKKSSPSWACSYLRGYLVYVDIGSYFHHHSGDIADQSRGNRLSCCFRSPGSGQHTPDSEREHRPLDAPHQDPGRTKSSSECFPVRLLLRDDRDALQSGSDSSFFHQNHRNHYTQLFFKLPAFYPVWTGYRVSTSYFLSIVRNRKPVYNPLPGPA